MKECYAARPCEDQIEIVDSHTGEVVFCFNLADFKDGLRAVNAADKIVDSLNSYLAKENEEEE